MGVRVPRRGLEPLILAEPDPKSGASTNFATSALLILNELRWSDSGRNLICATFGAALKI